MKKKDKLTKSFGTLTRVKKLKDGTYRYRLNTVPKDEKIILKLAKNYVTNNSDITVNDLLSQQVKSTESFNDILIASFLVHCLKTFMEEEKRSQSICNYDYRDYSVCGVVESIEHPLQLHGKQLNKKLLYELEKYPEMLDFIEIVLMGAKKYEPEGWLKPDGIKTSEKEMHDSMFHHLASSFCTKDVDAESGLDHLLHIACRALMLYTRRQRGIINDQDL